MATLKRGDKGEGVKFLQRRLVLKEDGIFGPLTEEAVKEFQKEHRLAVDGIVGDKTWAALMSKTICTRKITEIIVHCTATREGKDYTVNEVRQWHKARGFADIGYHYLIRLNGGLEEGRDLSIAGAHCVGHNTNSIGVCYVGGLDSEGNPKDTRTREQKIALKTLLTSLRIAFPDAEIHGHCDFAAKACPCFDATEEYREL